MISEMRENIGSRYKEIIGKIYSGTKLGLEDYDWLLNFPSETKEYYDFIRKCRSRNDILNIINSQEGRITYLKLLQKGFRRCYG